MWSANSAACVGLEKGGAVVAHRSEFEERWFLIGTAVGGEGQTQRESTERKLDFHQRNGTWLPKRVGGKC